MDPKRANQILSGFLTFFDVVFYLLLVVSLYTILASFYVTFSPFDQKSPFIIDSNKQNISVSIEAKNGGLLDSDFQLLLYGNSEIAASDTRVLKRNNNAELKTTSVKENNTSYSYRFNIKTLYNFVDIGIKMPVKEQNE